jgi:LytS/YehU family sensor histidine kinase
VHLIQQREDDLLRLARLEQARAEAELSALKTQVDPHFLFNSLNTLVHVIPRDPVAATAFAERLGDAYRYILSSGPRDLVPLDDELAFARDYVELLRLRFADTVTLEVAGGSEGRLVPPIALQVLVENAVKHNAFDAARPLAIRVEIEADHLRVSNAVRARRSARPGAGLGLRNLDQRCRRVLGRRVTVRAGAAFDVEVPLAVVRG